MSLLKTILSPSFALMAFAAVPSLAQNTEECKPDYQVVYTPCAHQAHGGTYKLTVVKDVLVNKGADEIVPGLCTDHIPKFIQDHPGAKNVKVRGTPRGKDNLFERGITSNLTIKKDVYCDFEAELLEPEIAASKHCPVEGVAQKADCYTKISQAAVEACLKEVPKAVETWWTKTACLLDAYNQAFELTPIQYTTVKHQLEVTRDKLSKTKDPNLVKLYKMVVKELN